MTSADPIIRDVSQLDEPCELTGLVSYHIRLLQIMAYKSFEQRVGNFGSAPRYYGLLTLIAANPGIPQARLAEALLIDRSSLVPILEALTREGWVIRRNAPQDKRVRRVFLTPEGQQRLTLLARAVEEHECSLTSDLTPDEKSQLLHLLDRLGNTMRKRLSRTT